MDLEDFIATNMNFIKDQCPAGLVFGYVLLFFDIDVALVEFQLMVLVDDGEVLVDGFIDFG